jgi:hypothetical protein
MPENIQRRRQYRILHRADGKSLKTKPGYQKNDKDYGRNDIEFRLSFHGLQGVTQCA